MSQKGLDDEQSLLRCMEDFRVHFITPSSEDSIHLVVESYIENLDSLSEVWCKKYKEGEQIVKKMSEIKKEIRQLNRDIEEKQAAILDTITKVKQNEHCRAALVNEIQDLKEVFEKKRACILANRRANKDCLKELHKAANTFKERLGLEIRKVCGDRLQFVFRCINHRDLDEPYTFILRINDQGDYELSECDPPLSCLSEFQQKVRETNNFSALLTNFRKAFTAFAQQDQVPEQTCPRKELQELAV